MNACVEPIPPTGKKENESSIRMLKSDAMKENRQGGFLVTSQRRCRTLYGSNCAPNPTLGASPKL